LRAAVGFRFAPEVREGVLAFARVAEDAAALAPPPRFALRWPGRDLGRLPRTPGSSVSSAATAGKIATAPASPPTAASESVTSSANVG